MPKTTDKTKEKNQTKVQPKQSKKRPPRRTLSACSVPKCPNNSVMFPGMKFFRFPQRNKERCLKWLKCINKEDLINDHDKIISLRICIEHFNTAFVKPSNTQLYSDAVPTLKLSQSTQYAVYVKKVSPTVCDKGTQTTLPKTDAITEEQDKITENENTTEAIIKEEYDEIKDNFTENEDNTEVSFKNEHDDLMDIVEESPTAYLRGMIASTSNTDNVKNKHDEQENVYYNPKSKKETNKSDKPTRFDDDIDGDYLNENLVTLANKPYKPENKTKSTSTCDLKCVGHKSTMTEGNYLKPLNECITATEFQQFITLCDKFLEPRMSESVKSKAIQTIKRNYTFNIVE